MVRCDLRGPSKQEHWDWPVPLALAEKGILQTPLIQEFWLAESRRRIFSAMVPVFWNIRSLEVRSAPTLLAFCKSLKTCLYQLACGSDGDIARWRWISKRLYLHLVILRFFKHLISVHFNTECFNILCLCFYDAVNHPDAQ